MILSRLRGDATSPRSRISKSKNSIMNNSLRTTRQKATIFRITGLVIAAIFMFWLKSQEATLPQEGFLGKTFCNVMIVIGLVVFAIGSVLRIRAVREENQ